MGLIQQPWRNEDPLDNIFRDLEDVYRMRRDGYDAIQTASQLKISVESACRIYMLIMTIQTPSTIVDESLFARAARCWAEDDRVPALLAASIAFSASMRKRCSATSEVESDCIAIAVELAKRFDVDSLLWESVAFAYLVVVSLDAI